VESAALRNSKGISGVPEKRSFSQHAQKPCIMSGIPGVKNHFHMQALQNMPPIFNGWFLTNIDEGVFISDTFKKDVLFYIVIIRTFSLLSSLTISD